MHFLVIGINYTPELISVAPFTTGLCEYLREKGHQVTVVTGFPYYPQWRIYDGYRGRWYSREQIRGVDVCRVIHYVPSRPRNLWQRLAHYASFSFNALLAALPVRKVDAVICVSPPPFVPLVAWLVSRLKKTAFIVKLTDLSSDLAVSVGMMRNGSLLLKGARFLEHFAYTRAAAISVLCPAFKETLLLRGVPESKVEVIPEWAELAKVRSLDSDDGFRQSHCLEGFLVLHAGNMGLKQGLRTFVEAARIANETTAEFTFLLVGEGEERPQLEELAQEYRLPNFRFLPLQPTEAVPSMFAAADVLVLVQRADVTASVIPTKLLMYMAAGRPVVASVNPESTAAQYIREACCGIVVPPEDPQALLDALTEIKRNPSRAVQLGQSGQEYVEKKFSKDSILERYQRFFGTVFSHRAFQEPPCE